MSLNKKRMVREIGRRTRFKNRDVERVIETLVELWTEELVAGHRIEIEHFLVLDVQTVERAANQSLTARKISRVTVRGSNALRKRLNLAVGSDENS
jgi:nucleoid DNA-binding protein